MALVRENVIQARVEVGDQLDVLTERPLQQLRNAGDHIVEVENAWLHHFPACEGQELMCKPGSPLGGKLDLLYVGHDGIAGALTGWVSHALGGEGRVVRDDAEQVVEVMRYSASELAEAFQPLRLMQLRF
jgi:hypothetical protein